MHTPSLHSLLSQRSCEKEKMGPRESFIGDETERVRGREYYAETDNEGGIRDLRYYHKCTPRHRDRDRVRVRDMSRDWGSDGIVITPPSQT